MAHLQLIPNGEQQFCDANGEPFALGTVGMYVPNTLNEKDTWQDRDHLALNTNPIDLDAAGRCVIWGNGAYRQILKDVNGNTVWDKETQVIDADDILAPASTTEVLQGTSTTKAVTPDALAALWEQGANVTSAATLVLDEGGFFHITGGTGISDIDFLVDEAGREAILVFDGVLILTNGANLILPSGADITTAAGDCCKVVSEGSDVVRMVWYQRADGSALVGSVDFGTSAALSAAITLLGPAAYWKMNDASGSLVDSSGNGFHITGISGTVNYNFTPLFPFDDEKYFRFGSTTARATLTTPMGQVPPLTGNVTVVALLFVESLTTNQVNFFQFGGDPASETEANNVQMLVALTTAALMATFWEHGAGVNDQTNSVAFARVNEPLIVAAVKDGTANTITFYRNGRQVGAAVAYTNEPSGGSGTMRINLGYDGVTNTNNFVMGHLAFINEALSADEIYDLAVKAGLTGG
jgi:Concanavalin A-like lectin/glucanases superfamily